MAATPLVVLTTVGSVEDARTLVRTLVRERVIACGTILPVGTSIYRWNNELKEEPEVMVVMKTEGERWDALQAAVRARHPYVVPELLALPVDRGLDKYLSWLEREVMV